MIVLDASVLLATAEPDSPHHKAARSLLRTGRDLATIDLAVYEVANTTALRWRDLAAGTAIRRRIWAIERFGRLLRVDESLAVAAAELVGNHGLTAYDAAYVAAANRLGGTLVSCDVKDLVEPGFAVLPGDA